MFKPRVSVLARDPSHRQHSINGYAFQQDAILSFRNYQYVTYWASGPSSDEPLYVHLSRRRLPEGSWETICFDDYAQATDDGHNTIQIGVCPGDGTLHLSFDHHCDILRYRHSIAGLALDPSKHVWDVKSFTRTLDYLPGLPGSTSAFQYVTYPRFFSDAEAVSRREKGPVAPSVFLTLRDGKAGLGNDHLFVYHPAASASDESAHFSVGKWESLNIPLTGVKSNPYVHGWDFRGGRIHVTWVYRDFVEYTGWDNPLDTKHKQQAGPNGAENNHDICYAYSEDGGRTWRSNDGDVVADVLVEVEGTKGKIEGTIKNNAPGIVTVNIPKGHGLMNQVAQAVDSKGAVHVLNRDDLAGNGLYWKHHYRDSDTKKWTTRRICRSPEVTKRGRVAAAPSGDLYFILPDPNGPKMRILKSSRTGSEYGQCEEVWCQQGLTQEPLVDGLRLQNDNVLSLCLARDVEGEPGKRDLVVIDFDLAG